MVTPQPPGPGPGSQPSNNEDYSRDTLKTNKAGGTFVSVIHEQEFGDTNWTSFAPSYKVLPLTFPQDPRTTALELVTYGGPIPVEGELAVGQAGTETTAAAGTLGPVTSTYEKVPVASANIISRGPTDNSLHNITFNHDGSVVYFSETDRGTLYSSRLSENYNLVIEDADFNSTSFDVLFAEDESYNIDICSSVFSPDGGNLFILDQYGRVIHYVLDDPWNIWCAQDPQAILPNKEVVSYKYNLPALAFSTDGSYMYTVKNTTNISTRGLNMSDPVLSVFISPPLEIQQYALTSPFDISNGHGTPGDIVYLDGRNNRISGTVFSPDGTTMFVLENTSVCQYSLAPGFALESATLETKHSVYPSTNSEAQGLAFSPDGSTMFVGAPRYDKRKIYSFALTTPWDLSDGIVGAIKEMNTTINVQDFRFSAAGDKLITISGSSELISYTLSTPFNITSASQDPSSADISYPESASEFLNSNYRVFSFNDTGSKLYAVSTDEDLNIMCQWTLSVPYDISTLTQSSPIYNFDGVVPDAKYIAFDSTGTLLFVSCALEKSVRKFTLSTPWDITTASFFSGQPEMSLVASVSLPGTNVSTSNIDFSNDGLTLYTTGWGLLDENGNATTPIIPEGMSGGEIDNRTFPSVNEYSLSVPFDITTATFSSSLNLRDKDPYTQIAYDIHISPDNENLCVSTYVYIDNGFEA